MPSQEEEQAHEEQAHEEEPEVEPMGLPWEHRREGGTT